MADSEFTAPEVTQLAEGLHRALSKLISMLRRGDPNGAAAGDLTLAQLSILVTLLDQGPIRMTDLAAHERVPLTNGCELPPPPWRSGGSRRLDW